jgi:hypothetical protein
MTHQLDLMTPQNVADYLRLIPQSRSRGKPEDEPMAMQRWLYVPRTRLS